MSLNARIAVSPLCSINHNAVLAGRKTITMSLMLIKNRSKVPLCHKFGHQSRPSLKQTNR